MATRELIEEGQDLIAQIDYLSGRYYDPTEGYDSISFQVIESDKVVLDTQKLIDEAPPDLKAGIQAAVTSALETAFETIEAYISSTQATKETALDELGST